jgi:hypothetical protein
MLEVPTMAWRLARSLTTLQAELNAAFPHRTRPDWTIGDPAHRARASDHNPRQDGVVCAIDVRGADTARALWEHLLKTRDRRVKYVIFDRKLVSAVNQPWVIRPYRGANPHSDHLHLSVGRGPDGRSTGPVDDTAPWGLLAPQEDDMTEDDFKRIARHIDASHEQTRQWVLDRLGIEPKESLFDRLRANIDTATRRITDRLDKDT